jgi:hypothetical protein
MFSNLFPEHHRTAAIDRKAELEKSLVAQATAEGTIAEKAEVFKLLVEVSRPQPHIPEYPRNFIDSLWGAGFAIFVTAFVIDVMFLLAGGCNPRYAKPNEVSAFNASQVCKANAEISRFFYDYEDINDKD